MKNIYTQQRNKAFSDIVHQIPGGWPCPEHANKQSEHTLRVDPKPFLVCDSKKH